MKMDPPPLTFYYEGIAHELNIVASDIADKGIVSFVVQMPGLRVLLAMLKACSTCRSTVQVPGPEA